MSERVFDLFRRSVEAKMAVGEDLAEPIERAAECLIECFLNEGKVLSVGLGPSAALAELFCAQLVHRFEKERPALPAIFLGGDAGRAPALDAAASDLLARPLRALGRSGDILILISSGGSAPALLEALQAAQERDVKVVALLGRDGGQLAPLLGPDDVLLHAAVDSRARVHEIHLLTLFCLSDLIDHKLFGMD